MGTINALDNYKRLESTLLRPGSKATVGGESIAGETVLIAAIDGRMSVSELGDDGRPAAGDRVRWLKASLFMTERHAVAYQARSGMMADYGMAVPYSRMASIEYAFRPRGGRRGLATCVMAFTPAAGSELPLVAFEADVDDVFAFDGIIKTIESAAAVGGIPCRDRSDRDSMRGMGLARLACGGRAAATGGAALGGDANAR